MKIVANWSDDAPWGVVPYMHKSLEIFNDDRSKFDEINDKFKNHFAVTKMSDAIQEQKHIEYIISIINKKEVA